jgi:ubiquinone/menaquinone biosynthesis C-methylase UbiE
MPSQHVCPWWLAYTFDHRLRRVFHKAERILAPYVKPGMTVLDLGCGMGYFSIPMAVMVGDAGRVLSVDIQQEMLDVLMRRARAAGVDGRIGPHLCEPERLRVEQPADFALAFFMVHETPDPASFLDQVRATLKPGAHFLYVEPKWHVPRRDFEQLLDHALKSGFRLSARPHISISHAALLTAMDA